MPDTDVMMRDPALVPAVPGLFALANKRRRFAYLSWSQNLQKRSHALAHMLDSGKCTIKDLPVADAEGNPLPPGEFMFIVLKEGVTPEAAEKSLMQLRRPFVDKNYRLIEGMRSPVPMVTLGGKPMELAEAIKATKLKRGKSLKYTTAWRRLDRGWTLEQALGIAEPPPRWGKKKSR